MTNSDIIKIGFDYRASLAQFEKETNGTFDGISEKARKQKIVIQLDAKDDKIIEKIKELQKLKLDNFTFEFGNSGAKEQLKTFAQLENKIIEIINLSKGIKGNSPSIINVKDSNAQIDKLQNKLEELDKRLNELSKKQISTSVSGKDIDLINNEEFRKLSIEVETLKTDLKDLSNTFGLLREGTVDAESFIKLSENVTLLTDKIEKLDSVIKTLDVDKLNSIGNKTNILSDTSSVSSQQKSQSNSNNSSELSENKKAWDELTSAIKEYSDVSKKIEKNKALDGDVELVKELKKRIDELRNSPILSKEQIESAQSKIDKLNNSLTSIKDSMLKSMKSDIDGFQKIYDSRSSMPKDKNQSDEYKKNLELLSTIIKQLNDEKTKLSSKDVINDEDIKYINKLKESANKCTEAFKHMSAAEKGSTENSRMKMFDKIGEYLKNNSKISKEFRQELEALQYQLKNGGASVNVNNINEQFLKVKDRIREAGQEGKRFFDIFNNKVIYGFASQLAMYYLSFYDFIRYGRNAISTIRELDAALVDLKKTTTMSKSELESFYYNSNDVAKQMGVTTEEIINQASAWSRLGYSSNEAATQMAKLSSQFASISPGMDTSTAQSGLVSIMKAWDIDVSDVKSEIMDNINILGNSFAETNEDIIEGMERSAAALSAMGTSYEEAFALFTGGQEILQNSERMGTALRSLSMRVRGYSEDSEEGLEELDESLSNISGDLIDLTKTSQNLEGISIYTDDTKNLDDANKKYKSMVQYLGEISDAWSTFSETQQTKLLQTMFGKTGAQAGAAIITNFDAVRDALEAMENSAGSADREMSTIEQSLDYKINSLKQTWVGTVQQMVDRGDFGNIIDGLTKLSEGIGFLISKLGLLGTAITAIYTVSSMKNGGGLIKLIYLISTSPFLATVEFNSDVYDSYICV